MGSSKYQKKRQNWQKKLNRSFPWKTASSWYGGFVVWWESLQKASIYWGTCRPLLYCICQPRTISSWDSPISGRPPCGQKLLLSHWVSDFHPLTSILTLCIWGCGKSDVDHCNRSTSLSFPDLISHYSRSLWHWSLERNRGFTKLLQTLYKRLQIDKNKI